MPSTPSPDQTLTLQNLQTERRQILRQLAELFSPSTKTAPPPISTEYLPSVHAHTLPVPPLTASEEAEVSERAQVVIKKHIKLLHRYNEMRDVGMGLIGMVADSRGVRIRDCQEEFGIEDGD